MKRTLRVRFAMFSLAVLAACVTTLVAVESAHAREAINPLDGIEAVNRSKSCFTGPFETYEAWVSLLDSKNENFDRDRFANNYPEADFKRYQDTLNCSFFSYAVDGLDIGGYFVAPKGGTDLPVIIFNRGGTATFGQMTFAAIYTHVFDLAQAGFVVIGSQYRGGMGKPEEVGGRDEWGGRDVNDVTALFDIVNQLPIANSERLGMYGASRGVVNMFRASLHAPHLKAMVSASGVYDLAYDLEFRPTMMKVYEEHMAGFNDNREEALRQRSVLRWLDQLNPDAPILILHGSWDKRTSSAGALSFAMALQERWHPYGLVIFENDDHFLTDNREEAVRKTIDWFKKYL